MSGDDTSTHRAPWWERQLPAIAGELRELVRRRLPGLPAQHDDLVNEALAGLAERILRHADRVPASWLGAGEPERDEEREYLAKLATTILRRRIADLFRARAHTWGRAVSLDEPDGQGAKAHAVTAGAASAEKQSLLARMLRVCVGALAELSAEDRDLLSTAAGLDGAEPDDVAARPLTDRERQRLRRARARLLDEVRRQLGSEAAELLRGDD